MCLTNFQWKVLWNSLEIQRLVLIQIDRHRSLCALFILSWRKWFQSQFSLSIRTKGLPPIRGDYVLFVFMWTSERARTRSSGIYGTDECFQHCSKTFLLNMCTDECYKRFNSLFAEPLYFRIIFLSLLCFFCASLIWFFLCQPTSPDILNPIEIHYFTRSTSKKITRWLN